MSQIKKQFLINIIIFGLFTIVALIFGRFMLVERSIKTDEESISFEGLSNEGYIKSFWDDFYYSSPKKDAICQIVTKTGNVPEATNNKSFCMDNGNIFLYDVRSGCYGIADIRGNWILKPEYYGIDTSHTDKGIIVIDKGRWYTALGVTDLNYNVLIEPDYEYMHFYDDYIYAYNYDNYTLFFALYNYEGNVIIGPNYGNIEFHDDYMIVEIDNTDGTDNDFPEDRQYGLYDHEGHELLKPEYSSISIRDEVRRLIVADKESEYRLLDYELNDILGDSYKSIELVSQGEENVDPYVFMIEDQSEKYYFCDPDGEKLSDNCYDYLDPIAGSDYLYIAKDNDKYGVVDCYGKIYLDFKYTDLQSLSYNPGYMIASTDDQYGVIDISGEPFIDFKYKNILKHNMYTDEMGDKYIVITQDNRIGVVTKANETIIEPQSYTLYEEIDDYFDSGHYRYVPDGDMLYFKFGDNKWVILKPNSLPVEFHFGDLDYLGGDLFLGKNFIDYTVQDYVIDSNGNIIHEFNNVYYKVEATTVYDKTLLVILDDDHLTIMYDGNIVREIDDTVNYFYLYENNEIGVSIKGSSTLKLYNYKGEYLN